MKTLGIIGGVGPQTTSEVYLSIVDLIRKNGREKYPPIVIYNLPFPFTLEHEAIVAGRNSEKMEPYLIEGAKILKKSGADIGILPCNTLHVFINQIREAAGFPFLNILEETALLLSSRNIKQVGILATETTIHSNLYKNRLENKSIKTVQPPRNEQDVLNNIIIQLLSGVKNAAQQDKLETICNNLVQQGADAILLACTDLQLIAKDIKCTVPIFDTTEILVRAAVREICE